ncbi:type II toxin-antitoxin system VapC family toxin [Gemmata sp. JC673]|uniref:Type II toxin-antitoxin system VapC family toxin n=1 Tax=Gemmata algarum TaxID=2975278 RepID=A0ABU5EW04_9BACT|nr:type II toxin-antitoxin system VapC family toxin [Gemmata algarum]MDY3559375.1 type II toxin-antitoxin system VapC family toxin [Gemmata algarum]
MVFVLDTDITTLVFQNNERVTAQLAARSKEEVAISYATWLEIMRGRVESVIKAATGVELLRAVTRLADSEQFLAPFAMLAIDQAAADRFDHLRALKKLNKMDRGDVLQAAIALANGATLVTRNTKDYAAVPGLKLDNWAA